MVCASARSTRTLRPPTRRALPRVNVPQHHVHVGCVRHLTPGVPYATFGRPNSLAISMRWTSLVPSPISRILLSRQKRATGNSFMKP
jgi:hypothetical protein